MVFVFYGSFCKCAKRERKLRKNEETKLILKSHILGTFDAISLKFGMWSTDIGGCVHSKIVLICKGSKELQWCKNHVFFLLVNILMVLRAGFLAT